MTTSKVRAYYATQPFRCAMCCDEKSTGRVYELNVWVELGNGYGNGTIQVCESCRGDFHFADLELDAPAMFEDWRRRQEEQPRETESEDRTNWLRAVQHATFPPYKG